MGRPLRVWEPDSLYHFVPKGNDGRPLFVDDAERGEFMRRATVVLPQYDVTVLAYCLMTNHAHFVVRCGEPGLSRPMQALFGGYARWWNRRRGSTGHLHHNRCYVTEPMTDSHFIVASAYVDLNPVRAGLVAEPEQSSWSSYRAHVGLAPPIPLLANDEFLRSFGSAPELAHGAYRRFVRSWQRRFDELEAREAA